MYEKIQLHDKIVKDIKKYIVENNLKIGDKLPSQEEFLKKFKISRSSLREAFRTLSALKIVQTINGKGSFVKNNNFIFEDSNSIINQKQELISILDVRESLELLAGKYATINRTDSDISNLRLIIEMINYKEKIGEKHAEDDKKFHFEIFLASHSPVLIDSFIQLETWFDKIWDNPLGAGSAFRKDVSYHNQILEAIENRDIELLNDSYKKMFSHSKLIINNI